MPERIDTNNAKMRHIGYLQKKTYNLISSSPIAVSTLHTSAIFLLRLAIQASTLILLGKLIGSEQIALFAAISATALILGSCTNLGMNLLLLKELSNDPKLQQEILAYALPSIILAGLAALSLYIFLVLVVFKIGADQIYAIVTLGLAEIVITPIISLASAIHLAARRTSLSQFLLILQNLLRLIALTLIFILHVEAPLYLYLYSYALIATLTLLVAIATTPNAWPPLFNWHIPRLSDLRKSSGFGSLNVTNIATSEIDKILIIKLIPAASAGIYVIGMRVIGAFALPVTALIVSSMPRLFSKHKDNKSLINWLFLATIIYGLTAAGVIWTGAPLLGELFRENYSGLDSTIRDMSLIIPGLAMKISASNIFMTQRNAWHRAIYETINIAILVLLFNIFCSMYGLKGAIFAAIFTEWTMGVSGWAVIFAKRLIQK